MALNVPRFAAIKALCGHMGWSTFRGRLMKITLRYRVKLERVEGTKYQQMCKETRANNKTGMTLVRCVHHLLRVGRICLKGE